MELRDEPFGVEVIDTRTGYTGRVWDVVEDRLRYGGNELVRHYVDHPGAVAVVAIDERDRVLLLQQYRHPLQARDWEIPAGLRDVPGEEPVETAKRELAEEADLTASDWSLLGEFALTPGGSNERILIYLATGLDGTDEPYPRDAEEADIRVAWLPLPDAIRAVRDGRFVNATTALGLLTAADRLRQ
ncbi:NUDIX domain-containing protein [Microbacterium sp. JB110]|uniref:NUDIX domain-containing protein n=1 Tax=Microbacterium sp. JB110 TaxID=2024477 RepID=UPI00097ED01A|nr:NUDIX hydrolase [Microbacterium sp. JB110]SJM63548.1 ADP-ribose pyrophosphatase [Frigoribacterium sp. JB110]